MVVNESDARAQLQRILRSEPFISSARCCEFLRFCVEEALDGRVDELKESTVGVAVFGRSPDYDPKTDAIVRVHARRVREKLAEYYSTQGHEDPIEITIPKGRYAPAIIKRLPSRSQNIADWGTAPENETQLPSPASRRVHWLWLAGVSSFAALILGVTLGTAHQQAPVHPGHPVPFASFPGLESSPTWAPDGLTIAYTWDEGKSGAPHVFLQRVSEAQPHRLTSGRDPEIRPVWSSDGGEVAFLRPSACDGFAVVRHRLSDATEKTVATFSFYSQSIGLPALDWSPDGSEFLVSAQSSLSSPPHLELLRAATGEKIPLTTPAYGTSGDFEARFSPNGSTIAFRRGGLGDIYTVSSRGESKSQAKRLTSESLGVRGLTWSADGRSIFYGGYGRTGRYEIQRISADGGIPSEVSATDLQSTDPTASRDGKSLAFERHDLTINLVRESIGTPGQIQYLSPSNQLDGSPAFSPNGRSLLFESNRSGYNELWVEDLSAGGLKQITSFRGEGIPLTASWSPDGGSIVLAVRAAGATNLYTYSVPTGNIRKLTFEPNRLIFPVYSADERFIYFSSNAQGATRIWRIASDGSGRPEAMYGDTAVYFQQSEDGNSLFFAEGGKRLRIMRRDLQTGSLDEIFTSDRSLYSVASFAVAAGKLYLLLSPLTGAGADLVQVDPTNGKARTVSHIELGVAPLASGIATLTGGIAISPDGHSIVFSQVRHANSDIYRMQLEQTAGAN